jgi:pimeloyl-ACP methyl ester carboxylesterase
MNPPQCIGFPAAKQSRLGGPFHKVGGGLQIFARIGRAVAVQGVGEIEHQIAAEKFIVHVDIPTGVGPLTSFLCNHYIYIYRLQLKLTMSGESVAIQSFQPPYSQSAVQDLRERLAHTRWPDTIPGSGWEYGFDLAYLQRICRYWSEEFDCKAEIGRMASLHHLRYIVGDQSVHFIHERGRGPSPIPILLLHGWPGSFLEMLKLVSRLTDPAAHGGEPSDSFDVVVASLPGFGFSSRPTERGMNTARMADLFAELMTELGYARFACHGGDFGVEISSWLGRRHAARIIALHLNYSPGSYRPGLQPGALLSQEKQQFLADVEGWEEEFGAYDHVQFRTPQTLAYGLNDSPAALAAWILEKFRDWSDCGGNLEKRFTWDELLANVTFYWMTETIHSSSRLYFEMRTAPLHLALGERIEVPCGIAHLPKQSPFPPRSWIERGYNVQHWTELASGGHFAAMEEPEALVTDIRTFCRKFRTDFRT